MWGWDLSQWRQALLNLYAGHHLSDEASMHPPRSHHVSPTPRRLPTSSHQPMRSTLLRIHSSYLGQGHHGSPSPALLLWITWGRHRRLGHPIAWLLQSRVILGLRLSRVTSRKQANGLPTSHTWKIWCVVSSQQGILELQFFASNVRCRAPLKP